MAGENALEGFLSKLEDPNTGERLHRAEESPLYWIYMLTLSCVDLKGKCVAATELRDNVELFCQGQSYAGFLQRSVPIFLRILDGPPNFVSTSLEQKLRQAVLEVIHRLPMQPADLVLSYARDIVDKLMALIRIENEENDIIIVKTISDILRAHTKQLEDKVQAFLDLIQEMFGLMEQTVSDTFDTPAQAPATGAVSTPGNPQYSQSPRPGSPVSTVSSDLGSEQQQTRQLQKGMHSFKVLSECPIIVVSIFQIYRSLAPKNVKDFVPLIKAVLMLQAKPQEKAHAEAKTRGDVFTGVSKEIKNRQAFGDFILMQVKTMSFLAYLLRVYANQLTDFLPTLPDIVVRMLKDCPRERSSARKELLVAIRHIINFNFRKIFLKKIDELLDERTLIGDGLTVYETMRPLAYSMLADLIHHLRESLNKEQIRRTIEVYTKNLHDDFPGTSFQTMSAKLLLNMAECIAKLEPKEDARHFLIMILNAIGDKFAAMNRQLSSAEKLSAQYTPPTIEAHAENYLADKDDPPDWDEFDIVNAVPIKTSNPRERNSDPVADNKFLFKNLLHGLKNLFYQLRTTNPPSKTEEPQQNGDVKQESPPKPEGAPANWHEVSYGYTAEELQVLIKLFHEGCQVFRYYGVNKPKKDTQSMTASELLAMQQTAAGEEKELLETFATVFHYVDPATFHEIFHSEIPHLYDMCFKHPPVLHIAQFLLASEATSPNFCGMLLQFLMGKIEEVGTSDTEKASILLRLFKLSFMAVTLFAQQNEMVLLPHVTKIATKSIQLSTTAEEPTNYFLLLRSLFRSIGGGRFEHLYKELLPLLEMLLEVLNNLLDAARKPQDRDLFVELILTVPARLSNLLPHLNLLMRPLVVALRATTDLVGQGLRTLELCVDNLTADYIDPIMAPVIDELMEGLWQHLRPHPYSHYHSHTTLRILGKLGGRNRKFLDGLPPLDYKPYTDDEASFDIRLVGTAKDRPFPTSIGIDHAIGKLAEVVKGPPWKPNEAAAKASDLYHKRQAFKFIIPQIKLLIGLENLPDDFAQLVRLQANDLSTGKRDIGPDLLNLSEREKSAVKRDAEQDTLKKLLKAVLFAHSIPELKDEASAFMRNIARHFVLLEIGRAWAYYKHRNKPFDVNSGEGLLYVESLVIKDVIAESLGSDTPTEREAAEQTMLTMRGAANTIFGSRGKSDNLLFFTNLARTFAHDCHEVEWYVKAGGVLGIDIMVNKFDFSDEWMVARHLELVRALVYVLKDMPPDITAKVRIHAEEVMQVVIRRVAKTFKKEDLENKESRLSQMCRFLVLELAHMVKHVRLAAQNAFSILAEAVGAEVHELIEPVKNMMLPLIFNKPLRALPFGAQIGYIDAVAYCLKLPNIVEYNDMLTRLLMECMALADADDETLTTKPSEQRNAENIVNLRVGCIKLLTVAQTIPEFGGSPTTSSQSTQTRSRVIAVFFKSLYSKSPEVVEAANTGLKTILQATSKLPKDLLHAGLRPILMNLQDPRKLTVDGLEGLARLLRLLTSYFKVEIGTRLLDHLKTIAEPNSLKKISFTLIEQNRQMRIIAAILNVFHLLPPNAANIFLPNLVQKVIELEDVLRRTQFSPFREPLIKYLNQYPRDAFKYFAPKIKEEIEGRFFAQLLSYEEAEPLRKAVTESVEHVGEQNGEAAEGEEPEQNVDLLSNFSLEDGEEKEKAQAKINAIHIAHSVCKYKSTANIVKHEALRKAIFESGEYLERRLRDNDIEPSLRLAAEQAGEQVIDLLVTYLEQEPGTFEMFLELVEAVTAGKLKSTPTLFHFIYEHMISKADTGYCKALVLRCIEEFANRSTSQQAKTFLFHHVVNPILAMDVAKNWASLFAPNARGTKLVDKSLIDVIHNKLWRPALSADATEETGQLGVDHSRMELLQLTALLLKYHTNLMLEPRKDVIKFGWNWIKLEDVINKHATFVVISYFIALYDSPAKITSSVCPDSLLPPNSSVLPLETEANIVKVYQSLLKAHQNEGRALVAQALELLAPVLTKRMRGPVTTGQRLPLWAHIPKRIIAEETHNLQQLMSIFNFFVRHPDLFYGAKEALAPPIIQSLSKIAQPPSPSNESKKIALNLINMIWIWEERAYKESLGLSPSVSPQTLKRKADGTPVDTTKPRTAVPNPGLKLALIKYLFQFVTSLPERYPLSGIKPREEQLKMNVQPAPPSETCRMAVRLLHSFLQPPFWSDMDIDVLIQRFVEPALTADPEEGKQNEYITKVVNALQVLKVIVNDKPDDWILNHMEQWSKLLEKPVKIEDVQVQECLHGKETGEKVLDLEPLFKRILAVIPDPPKDNGDDEAMEDAPGSDFLSAMGAAAGDLLSNNNYTAGINLLWSICQRRPSEVDAHTTALMKAFSTKLAKEHLMRPLSMDRDRFAPREGQPLIYPLNWPEAEIETALILKSIDILAARVEVLGEQRRPFLSTLAGLVERSSSKDVCNKILDLAEKWIFSSDGIPTLKEKVAVLTKMLYFEHRDESRMHSFANPNPTSEKEKDKQKSEVPQPKSPMTRFLELIIRVYEDPKVTRTELTVRLENAFLIGTRAYDVDIRNRFLTIFDRHISRTLSARLDYVLCHQDWATLEQSFWLSQVIQLLCGSMEMNAPISLRPEDFKTMSLMTLLSAYSGDQRGANLMLDDSYEALINEEKRFCQQTADIKLKDIIDPLVQLQHTDRELAREVWIHLFPIFWSAVPRDERSEFQQNFAALLTKDYHNRQLDQRPNCVQALLEGLVRAKPRIVCPPHLVKFLARTYNVWYVALDYLENAAINPLLDTPTVRESTLDALVELYADIKETDLFYGTWRRRCQYVETNAALSYEQMGMWDKAQQMYETAQIKARTGTLPFSQGEYMLWEDHWVLCAERLQQWEILMDFARHENFNDLYLEASWRIFEPWHNTEQRDQLDSILKAISDAPTPRRTFFQAFMTLLKFHAKIEGPNEFNRACDEAMQLSIRKWHQLPTRITLGHIPLLENFQHLIELHDAQAISRSLSETTAANLDVKSQELKMLLGTWRDRLPNFWDDINAWQGLVCWRQHIFQLINSVYLQLVPPTNTGATSNSFACRGYHETAWIINRFAHVARQHNLPEVCIAQLSKIYTLPNIEIQEAFLKLREQAKCHYQNKAELNSGLDVINNTNLNYFGQQQKAEFYTLKGMFLNKLGQTEPANEAFGSALYFDIKLPKAWAEWGHYNDQLFKEDPTDLDKASSAISCYLEAAGQFKNAKSRKLLARILWLLSLDDSEQKLVKTFDSFKGDTPVWYWITYIPQLLLDLSKPEAPVAAALLKKIAKIYPQALYYQLRTSREDMVVIRKQQEQKDAREKELKERQAKAKQGQGGQGSPKIEGQGSPKQSTPSSRPLTANGETSTAGEGNPSSTPSVLPNATPKLENGEVKATSDGGASTPSHPKKPWEYMEDIYGALKTAFPLLAWSMESMVDQINKHFKCLPDEDAHRLIVALLNDGIQYISRQPALFAPEVKLPAATEANITRFADSVCPQHVRPAFKADFVNNKPSMYEYIQKLRKWRNRFEERLDRRLSPVHLESLSPLLTEFRFQRFDEVEVPGQYLLHKDKNQDFIRIDRFLPGKQFSVVRWGLRMPAYSTIDVDLVRGTQVCHRRLKIRGHDGSIHPFQIQHPAGRHCRREERVAQLFRIFNATLLKRRETRRRNLQFNLPVMVPLSSNVRMIEDDASYVSLQAIYEDYCRRSGVNKDEPILYTIEKLREHNPVIEGRIPYTQYWLFTDVQKNLDHAQMIRLEMFNAIQEKFVPNSVVQDYFRNSYKSYDDHWLFRRAFAYQFAALTFMTYIMCINQRYPHKLNISRRYGKVWGAELVSSMSPQKAIFSNAETVPFRLTPNLQALMGPLVTEGIFAPSLMAIARSLTEPEGEMELQLSIFVRDEVSYWFNQQHKQPPAATAVGENVLRDMVQANSEYVVKRARTLAQPPEGGNLPAFQTVVDLISQAVNPARLAQSDPLWMPYL